MSDLIRDLADSAISDIKDEINGMSEDDLTTWEREENLIVISGVEIIGKKKS